MSALDNPAWCKRGHERTGIVSNQDPSLAHDRERAYASVATCSREECIGKGIKYVAGETNETAAYSNDEERWAAQRAAGVSA